ncbi:MAG TPA: hypothetical protein V6C81_19770 [Planktothrix sp.]|jgi:hypothetical protein
MSDNCYNFDLPDECLNAEETRDVINALMFDLRRVPAGGTFVFDIAIGPASDPDAEWDKFLKTRKKFNRAEFHKEKKVVEESEVINFLREHFDDMLTLPRPGLRRVK